MDLAAVAQALAQGKKLFPRALSAAPTGPVEGVTTYIAAPSATPVIIDTDFWTDAGDVPALRTAAACERGGLIDIRAILVDTTFKQNPAAIDALMTAELRPGVPIGKSHTTHVPDGTPPFQQNMMQNNAHLLGMSSVIPDSVTQARTVLAASTRKVDVISIGYMNNLADLLASPADGISTLTGAQLVAAKVRTLWVMGGDYPDSTTAPSGAENNFKRTALAISSAVTVVSTWPTPIYFLGFTAGNNLWTGANLRTLEPSGIVAQAFIDQGSAYGRPSWDAMLVRLAALNDPTAAGYTTVRGTNSVNASTGANTFTPSSSGNHYYVVKAQSDDWFLRDLSPLLAPGATATASSKAGTQVYQDGQWKAADPAKRALGTTSARTPTVIDSTLLMQFNADDLTDWNDGSTFAHWPDRTGLMTAQQYGATTQRPTFRAAVGGKTAVTFAAGQNMQTPNLYSPRDFTVYALCYFTTVPTASQIIFSIESLTVGGSFPPKGLHLGVNATGLPFADRFYGISATTDTAAAAIAANTWTNIACRYSVATGKIEVLVGSVGGGGTTLGAATPTAGLWIPANIGGRYYDDHAANMLSGSLHSLRFYNVRHDNATVAATVAAMT